MIDLLLFLLFISSILIFYRTLRKTSSTPNGLKDLPHENGIPIVGICHQIKGPLCVHLSKLGHKHGPLFRVRLGMRDIVVLNNYDVIKKALKDDGDNFAGRFKIKYFEEGTRGVGLLVHDGPNWAKQRAFIFNVFREFGVTSSRYLEIIQSECSLLLNTLESMNGKKTDFDHFIETFISNVILKFLINKRFDLQSEKMKDSSKLLLGIAKSKDIFQNLSIMFPFLDQSTLFFKFITLVSREWKLSEKIHEYFQEQINEHLKLVDFSSEGENLVDCFLIKQRELKKKTGDVDSFTDWQLIRNIIELFMAGFETLSTTLGWSLMFMSKYPEIQNKVYWEIIDKIGNKQPSMNDKVHLVYTQAVMDEIQRMASAVPLAIAHKTYEDCSLDGYFIPKKSIIFPNLYACHYDPGTWERPMEFNPERFLVQDNNGELKYVPRKKLIPFSIGKRQCLGNSLARMEYFIFFTRILQNFRVSFCEEINEKKYEEVLLANEGFIRQCSIKTFIFNMRH